MADQETRTVFADSVASTFKEFPTSADEIETDWCLFRRAVTTSATKCCVRKRVVGTKSNMKRTSWWNQEVKKAIRAKKWITMRGSQISHHLKSVAGDNLTQENTLSIIMISVTFLISKTACQMFFESCFTDLLNVTVKKSAINANHVMTTSIRQRTRTHKFKFL